jgi:hypothetical protein
MWSAVWKRASDYVGVDEVYKPWDPRRRFVGDNRIVMRAVDLQPFNVFDLDAFGDPWEQLVILAARRKWAPGERGAVLLTWRDSHTRWKFVSHALADAAGLSSREVKAGAPLSQVALRRFFDRSRVAPCGAWGARGYSTTALASRKSADIFKGGNLDQSYLAVIFDGLPQAKA